MQLGLTAEILLSGHADATGNRRATGSGDSDLSHCKNRISIRSSATVEIMTLPVKGSVR